MQIFNWQEIDKVYSLGNLVLNSADMGSGISVGSFDGLHLGHRLLIKNLTVNCKTKGYLSGVVTFTRPLPSLKFKSDYPGDVSTLSQRLSLFEELGIDFVILVDFTPEFAALSGETFFEILKRTCNLKYLVEGVDFRCGYKGATDVNAIEIWASKNDVCLDLIPPVISKIDGKDERISSSFIRKLILQSNFPLIKELTTRPYEIDFSDSCDCGNAISRRLINQVIPKNGIYDVQAFTKAGNEEKIKIIIDDENIKLPENKKKYKAVRF